MRRIRAMFAALLAPFALGASRAAAQSWPETHLLDSLSRTQRCPAELPPLAPLPRTIELTRPQRCALLALAWHAAAPAPSATSHPAFLKTHIATIRGLESATGRSTWYWVVCFERAGSGTDHMVYVDARLGRIRQAEAPKRCGEPPGVATTKRTAAR
jgi:hypothetical protein